MTKPKLLFKKAKRILTRFAKDYIADAGTKADLVYLVFYLENTTRGQEKKLLKIWEKLTGETEISSALGDYF